MDTRTFAGQTVVVTDAAGNLGRVTADAFAAAGARLVLVDLDGDALGRAIGDASSGHLLAPTDLLDRAEVDATVHAAVERFGRIDVLCNIAGGFRMGALGRTRRPGQRDPVPGVTGSACDPRGGGAGERIDLKAGSDPLDLVEVHCSEDSQQAPLELIRSTTMRPGGKP